MTDKREDVPDESGDGRRLHEYFRQSYGQIGASTQMRRSAANLLQQNASELAEDRLEPADAHSAAHSSPRSPHPVRAPARRAGSWPLVIAAAVLVLIGAILVTSSALRGGSPEPQAPPLPSLRTTQQSSTQQSMISIGTDPLTPQVANQRSSSARHGSATQSRPGGAGSAPPPGGKGVDQITGVPYSPAIPTAPESTFVSQMAALAQGTLRTAANGCIGFGDGVAGGIALPAGYHAVRSGSDIWVLDGNGAVVGKVGWPMDGGGGHTDVNGGECAKGAFLVQSGLRLRLPVGETTRTDHILSGTLQMDDRGCLRLRTGTRLVELAWPRGVGVAVTVNDGAVGAQIVSYESSGSGASALVAATGDRLLLRGSIGLPAASGVAPSPCITDRGKVFVIGSVPATWRP